MSSKHHPARLNALNHGNNKYHGDKHTCGYTEYYTKSGRCTHCNRTADRRASIARRKEERQRHFLRDLDPMNYRHPVAIVGNPERCRRAG